MEPSQAPNPAFFPANDDSTDSPEPPIQHGAAGIPQLQPRDRRREKPQLSCNYCKRRKIRCDRRLPCAVCVSKGIELSCSYAARPQQSNSVTVTVSERLHQLETLVRSFMLQQSQPQQSHPLQDGTNIWQIPVVPSTSSVLSSTYSTPSNGPDNGPSCDELSEHGKMREDSHGTNYVSSVHWAAVLDSISELIDQCEEKEKNPAPDDNFVPPQVPGPRLLYEPVKATKADILLSMPARPVVDRMVARYFNALGIAPAILHSAQFLREVKPVMMSRPSPRLPPFNGISADWTIPKYEGFWRDPEATPFIWIGLLFSVICLATQFQQPGEEGAELFSLMRIRQFHERIVQCLVLGQYTRGGPYVVETMINYCASELCITKDTDVGPWLPLGIMVPLAVSRGYHRDPSGFPSISPFTGEMRRRVWAAVVQMDLRLSSQMGLPHLLKSTQCNTAEPRNLFDTDFDEDTIELPPSRPETEVTPVLYSLAKNRIDRIGGPISDLAADAKGRPYPEIMALDRELQNADTSLPPIFRWQPLSQSFMIPSQVLMFRIWLRLAILRLVIWLHRKYLAPSYSDIQYQYSRTACARAALEIIEFQLLLDEETRPGGQLHQTRWMQSSLMQSTFLLGMSVACYYMQLTKTALPHTAVPDLEMRNRIRDRLRDTYPLWLRCSAVSRDAREAAKRLRQLPDLQGHLPEAESESTAQDSPGSVVPACWDIFHGTGRHARALDATFGNLDRPAEANTDVDLESESNPPSGVSGNLAWDRNGFLFHG